MLLFSPKRNRIPKSTMSHNCTAEQLFLWRQSEAAWHSGVGGWGGGDTQSPNNETKQHLAAIKAARMVAADRRAGFPDKLTTQKRQSAAVPLCTSAVIGRVLWNLQNSHRWSVSLNSKHSQQKGMPQRQRGIPLIHLQPPLLGDICTRDGSLDCV